MSERFGIPDHSPQHAPDHSLQNPTAPGSWGHDAGSDWSPAPSPTYGGGGGGTGMPAMPYVDPRRRVTTAVVLAMIFGPLGLFYTGFLHGVAALFVVVPVARTMALEVVAASGGRINRLTAAVFFMWCITAPWAIIGTRRRNARIDRKGA